MILERSLPYYLTGTTHWLTKEVAHGIAQKNTPALVVDDMDGTWSVLHLSETPRVTGQPLARQPARPHKLYKGIIYLTPR